VRGPPARHPNDDAREQLPAPEGIIESADELRAGDRVVYPNQGVCAIVGWEVKEIAGQKLELVRMAREEDGAAVLVPKAKVPSIGLRRVATGDQMEGVFHYLAAQFDDPELDWKVRHRDNADRLIAGGVLGVAEVVKGLHSLSRIRPLPTKEREQYDNARHLLVHEIAVSLAVPHGLAEDYVDYALMPPAGVKFQLKPPPKPVMLPSRPKKRRVVAEEEDGDLGLADLGLGDLGVDLQGALDVVEGEADAEGTGEAAAEGEAEQEPAAEAEPTAGAEGADLEPEPEPEADDAEVEEEPAEEPAARPRAPAAKAKKAEKAPEKAEKPGKPAKPVKAAATKPAKSAAKPAPKQAPPAPAEKSASARKKAAPAARAAPAKPAKKPARAAPVKTEKKAAPKRGGKKR
jgi:RNA polymerase-interacting CarD/CdnL/TRCF family regulator